MTNSEIDSFPLLVITMEGDVSFTVQGSQYLIAPRPGQPIVKRRVAGVPTRPVCMGVNNTGAPPYDYFIIGDVAMKGNYVVHDMDAHTIGVVPLTDDELCCASV